MGNALVAGDIASLIRANRGALLAIRSLPVYMCHVTQSPDPAAAACIAVPGIGFISASCIPCGFASGMRWL